MRPLIFCLTLLSFLCLNCSSQDSPIIPDHIKELDSLTVYPADIEPAMEIQLVREQTFGSNREVLIDRPVDMAVDKTGRVYVSDEHTIHLFHPNGSYINSLGQKGRGPGEYSGAPFLYISMNQLYAYDPMQFRINVFSVDSLALLRMIKINSGQVGERFYIRQIFSRKGGSFLLCFSPLNIERPTLPGQQLDKFYREYYIMDSTGNIMADKIFEQKGYIFLTATIDGQGVRMATGFDFIGKSLMTVSQDGYIYSAWSDDFSIEVRTPGGKYLRSFYYPYDNSVLTRKDAINNERTKFRQAMVRQNELPANWPAMEAMLIDDQNRLWVSTIVDDQQVYQWWILDAEDGRLIARFKWPRDKKIEEVKNVNSTPERLKGVG